MAAHNFVIGTSLMSMLERCGADSTSSLELAAEVVNSLIDVYTEDRTHTQQVRSSHPHLVSLRPADSLYISSHRRFSS
jgi:hypothetical protein